MAGFDNSVLLGCDTASLALIQKDTVDRGFLERRSETVPLLIQVSSYQGV
jgi:hypothetical protein